MGWEGQPHAPAASTPGKDPIPIVQEAWWAPGPVWTGGKSRPHWDSNLDRPIRSQSLYRLSYPTHSFQFLTFSFFRSSITSSCYCCLGLPTGLVPTGFQSNNFLVVLLDPLFGHAPAISFFVPQWISLYLHLLLVYQCPCDFVFSIYCQYWQDQISSLVFAFEYKIYHTQTI